MTQNMIFYFIRLHLGSQVVVTRHDTYECLLHQVLHREKYTKMMGRRAKVEIKLIHAP